MSGEDVLVDDWEPVKVERTKASQPWSTRIPAAIARAKAEVGDRIAVTIEGPRGFVTITRTEVALAEPLWGIYDPLLQDSDAPPALRAFTEKIESLP